MGWLVPKDGWYQGMAGGNVGGSRRFSSYQEKDRGGSAKAGEVQWRSFLLVLGDFAMGSSEL